MAYNFLLSFNTKRLYKQTLSVSNPFPKLTLPYGLVTSYLTYTSGYERAQGK